MFFKVPNTMGHHAAVLPILMEIQELRKKFSSFRLDFVRCDANLAAHLLAKTVSPSFPGSTLLNQVLDFLVP